MTTTFSGTLISDLQDAVAKVQGSIPADGAICKTCGYPYEEHSAGNFCPNIWDEDTDWSTTRRFA